MNQRRGFSSKLFGSSKEEEDEEGEEEKEEEKKWNPTWEFPNVICWLRKEWKEEGKEK